MRKLAIPVILSVLLVLFAVMYANLPAVSVEARLSKTTALIGDRIRYSIEVVSSRGITPQVPDMEDELSEFEVLDKGTAVKKFLGKTYFSKWYDITVYYAGIFTIPGVEINYKGRTGGNVAIACKERKLTIRSLSKQKDYEDGGISIGGGMVSGKRGLDSGGAGRSIDSPVWFKIFEITEPMTLVPVDRIAVMAGIGITALVFLLIVLGIVRRATRKHPVKLTDKELAEKRLDELLKKQLSEKGLYKEFFFELSAILRDYLKSALNMGGKELTTKDFLSALSSNASLSSEAKGESKHVLTLSDLVKFSGHTPEQGEIEACLTIVRKFIRMNEEEKQ